MAAGTKRRNLQADAAHRHPLNRRVADSQADQRADTPMRKQVPRDLLQGAQELLVLEAEAVHTRHIELAIALKVCPGHFL